MDHAIFANVTGPACDSGLWDLAEDGRTQIFKSGSCVPDEKGQCPTSIRVSKTETKLWIKCGQGCWTKNIHHDEDEIPLRYRALPSESSPSVAPKCNLESFPDLCQGRCKYYDAWFCNETLICTDEPCGGKCPKKAGPKGEKFVLCDGECVPDGTTCGNKCAKGKFRCGNKCLDPKQVRRTYNSIEVKLKC